MPDSSGFATERTPEPPAPREKTAPGSRTARFSSTGRALRSAYESSTRSTTGDSPFGEAVSSAFHWKKRATGGFAPPSGGDRHPGRPGAIGLVRVSRPHREGEGRSRGHVPLAPETPERGQAQAILDGRGERAGGRTCPRARVAGFPAIPSSPRRSRARPRESRAPASHRSRPRGARGGPSTRTRARAGPSRRGALRPRRDAGRRIDSSGKSQPGSTKPSG